MAEWEYRKIDLNQVPRKTDEVDVLCDAGEEGWELVTILPNNVAVLEATRRRRDVKGNSTQWRHATRGHQRCASGARV